MALERDAKMFICKGKSPAKLIARGGTSSGKTEDCGMAYAMHVQLLERVLTHPTARDQADPSIRKAASSRVSPS